ncbi:class I SAM-dependent methyltransferase [Paenibacillus sp. UNC451MF]|uniref:class I SAM-dependent methyltransferase n=1 Tax=Paenibacillus sp. UNC451MF TaxID=1449063 RepID=UPI00048F1FA6|nr:class I SAM-dependent methyltransferase [Paenibacillus sp. UNC451MF]
MKDGNQYWNHIYTDLELSRPEYDEWLIKHESILEGSRNIPIIDLGCGAGGDSLFLTERGYRVIACDWSEEALSKLQLHIPLAETCKVDLREELPFLSDSAQVIIADLSLHYFSWKKTELILQELQRVLLPGGHLLCRVNSIHDIHFGAGEGIEIEPNYYEQNGQYKRFFDKDQVIQLFKRWSLVYYLETTMNRYHKPKRLWEIAAVNQK